MVASCNNVLHKLLPGELFVDVIFWFHAYITTHLRLRSSVPKGFVEFTNLLKQRKNLQAKLKTAKTAMTK
ncbi:Ninein [Trichinella spiralis]|uniref:Ninein n=1 Tax=Trichinella spiralis TaxID=6334 RepID=A0ABR3KZ61_TRISP